MKKSLTGVVTLLAGALVAHSQGTIGFGDAYTLTPYIYVSLQNGSTTTRLGGSSTVTTGNYLLDTGNGSDWTVALYGNVGTGDSSASIMAADVYEALATATLATGDLSVTPGTWLYIGPAAVIPGAATAGVSVSLQLAAWYNDGGTITSFKAAQSADVPIGLSAVATATTGGPSPNGGPPLTAPNLPSGLGNIYIGGVIPEPSTIALTGIGGLLFALYRRFAPNRQ